MNEKDAAVVADLRADSLSIGLARAIYVRCIYGILGREMTKYTVIYGAYIWFWTGMGHTA